MYRPCASIAASGSVWGFPLPYFAHVDGMNWVSPSAPAGDFAFGFHCDSVSI